MIKLNQHELNFEQALAYFQYNLADTNILSSALIKLVNFKAGRFFTLLPDTADLKKINEFRYGGMAGGVRDQISSIVLNKLHLDNKLSCIFDDATATFKPEYKDPFFLSYGLVYKTEIYYLVVQKMASNELINQCFCVSNAIWHSLCVLSEIDLSNKKEKNLSSKEIEDVCQLAQLIIVGAYDGEGYVFWEKSSST